MFIKSTNDIFNETADAICVNVKNLKQGRGEDKQIEYDGHIISQCGSNHHVAIVKDGKMLYHGAFDHDMTIDELIHFYNTSYQNLKKMSEKMFEYCFGPDYVDDDTEE